MLNVYKYGDISLKIFHPKERFNHTETGTMHNARIGDLINYDQ
jgi:hypothetical protein